jgi:hypothetical protein
MRASNATLRVTQRSKEYRDESLGVHNTSKPNSTKYRQANLQDWGTVGLLTVTPFKPRGLIREVAGW